MTEGGRRGVPCLRSTGPRSEDTGPRSEDAGLRSEDAGPRSEDAGLRSRDASPRSRDTRLHSELPAGGDALLPVVPASRRRARRSWARQVLTVDASLDGGWMFEGPWLERGEPAPLAPGDLVLLFDAWESGGSPRVEAVLQCWREDGWEEVARSRTRGWALELAEEARGRIPAKGVERRALEREIERVRGHLTALEARLSDLCREAP